VPVPSRQPPEQQAPPVQRLRIRYAKRGRLRFTSHRDFSRAFERAVFRARVPMAYSSGFNPHPRISYAGAAPTGAASEAEYLEIGLARVCDPEDVRRELAEALPDGLDVVEVVDAATGGSGSLADRLVASRWTVVVAAPAEEVVSAVDAFLAVESVPVERMTKKGLRTFDCRQAVVAMSAAPHEVGALLDMTLRHTVPAVRPDDVLTGLGEVTGLQPSAPPLVSRLRQGPLDDATGEVGDPLA
jgi:radical SAM-linked protein